MFDIEESVRQKFFVQCLGSFEVDLGVARIERLPTRRAQSLLLYLATRPGEKFTRSQILTDLWPTELEGSARQGLRQALYLIRRSIEDHGVPSEVWSDRDSVWLSGDSWASDWAEAEQGRLTFAEGQVFAPWNADDWCEQFRLELAARTTRLQTSANPLAPDSIRDGRKSALRGRRAWALGLVATVSLVVVASAMQRQSDVPDDPGAWSQVLAGASSLSDKAKAQVVSRFADTAFHHNYLAHEGDWLAVFTRNLPLIRSSFEWSVAHDRAKAALIAGSLWRYCHLSNHSELGRDWLSKIDFDQPGNETAMARAQGSWAFQLGMDGDAKALAQSIRARDRYRQLGDKWGVAHSTRAIGFAYSGPTDTLDKALATYKEARALFADIGDKAGVATTDVCIAAMGPPYLSAQSQLDVRLQAAADAYEGFSGVGNQWGRGFAIDRGWSHFALRRCTPSAAVLRRFGDSLREFADESWQRGEPLVGAKLMARSLQIDVLVGDSKAAARDCQWLGRDESNSLVVLGRAAYQVVVSHAAHADSQTWAALCKLKLDQ